MSSNQEKRNSREHRESGDFKVVDRRRFTAAGEIRADAPADAAPRPPSPIVSKASEPAAPQAAAATRRGPPAHSASRVDFLAFIGSLATNAMAAMGLLPPTQSRGMPKNLAMAYEYIEIIVMLQERTAGNLSAEEDQALRDLIIDLRGQYTDLQAPPPAQPGVR